MADIRRRSPEPFPAMPTVEHKPGLVKEMLRELAPLRAEEGIDVDNIDGPDLDTLQRALNRAVERRNMELFSPVGDTRDIAIARLRLVVQAILDGETALAGVLLDQVSPSRRTTRLPPSPAASASPTDCSMTGSPGKPLTPPSTSAHARHCPQGTGQANAPRPPSSCPRGRARLSAHWTNCSPVKAARKC